MYTVQNGVITPTVGQSLTLFIIQKQRKTDTRNFITDGTEKSIKIPYGIAINPETGEFFVTDAKDYVTPGTLYCFSRDGKKKWSVITGDIPAHIAFTDKKLKEIQ